MPDRPPGRDRLGRRHDTLRVDAEVAVEIGDGASLAEMLDPERADAVAAHAAERDEGGQRLVVRNGHARQRQVTTAAGVVTVRAPRVDDRRTDPVTGERIRFRSVILPPWCRKSPKVAEVLPLLYLHGLSTGDFVPALEVFFGSAAGLSAAVVSVVGMAVVSVVGIGAIVVSAGGVIGAVSVTGATLVVSSVVAVSASSPPPQAARARMPKIAMSFCMVVFLSVREKAGGRDARRPGLQAGAAQ